MNTQPRARKQWRELTMQQQVGIIVGGLLQVALAGWAVHDIRRRPAAQIRGPKALWYAASAINFVGPISYALFGRKPA